MVVIINRGERLYCQLKQKKFFFSFITRPKRTRRLRYRTLHIHHLHSFGTKIFTIFILCSPSSFVWSLHHLYLRHASVWATTLLFFYHIVNCLHICRLGRLPRYQTIYLWLLCISWWQLTLLILQAPTYFILFQCWIRIPRSYRCGFRVLLATKSAFRITLTYSQGYLGLFC